MLTACFVAHLSHSVSTLSRFGWRVLAKDTRRVLGCLAARMRFWLTDDGLDGGGQSNCRLLDERHLQSVDSVEFSLSRSSIVSLSLSPKTPLFV